MLIKEGKNLKRGDSVKFFGGKKHKNEYKDWAASEKLEAGEIYVVGLSSGEDGYFIIEGKALWHHPSRFELVKS